MDQSMMIGTDDGFWFSCASNQTPVAYEFRQWGDIIEIGIAATVDEVFDRFDAWVAKRRAILSSAS
jgi:hypothetical protein